MEDVRSEKNMGEEVILERRAKLVADSMTTQIQILMPQHINGQKRLFGGTLMQWMDVVAAVVARRHSGHNVTTACVDTLEFRAPAHVNNTLIIEGRMTCVGNTSMEVRVESFTEALDGERKLITSAYMVLVAIDENEQPVLVPRLELVTDEEKAEFENGKLRTAKRKECRKYGWYK